MTRVLVTEGTSYLGRHVLDALHWQGHSTVVPDEAGIALGDAALSSALEGVDAVICLMSDGAEDLVLPRLLRLMAEQGPARLVLESTLHVYGEGTYADRSGHLLLPRRRAEDLQAACWEPKDPEGKSLTPMRTPETAIADPFLPSGVKAASRERMAQDWAAAEDRHICILRLAQLFGPSHPDGPPPQDDVFRMLAEIEAGQSPLVAEDGGQVQDWLHVRDAARAMRLALNACERGLGPMNIGSGRGYRADEVAQLIASAAFRYDLEPYPSGTARPDLPRHLVGMTAMAGEHLGFVPELPLENSLGEMVLWMREMANRADTLAVDAT